MMKICNFLFHRSHLWNSQTAQDIQISFSFLLLFYFIHKVHNNFTYAIISVKIKIFRTIVIGIVIIYFLWYIAFVIIQFYQFIIVAIIFIKLFKIEQNF